VILKKNWHFEKNLYFQSTILTAKQKSNEWF
jgi:hypothetical protein